MAYTIKIKDIPTAKMPIKCPYPMDAIGFCVHNTANDASAENEISYMQKNDNYTSYHYAIDDRHVVRGLPLDRNSWHAGDGSTGEGNRKYIGIEICFSKSGGEKYEQAEENAIKFVAYEMYLRGWTDVRKHIKKHQDFSGKYCPHRIIPRWDSFLARIEAELEKYKEEPKEETFMLEKAIVVGSLSDYATAEPLAKEIKAPIYPTGVTPQAKAIIVIGGDPPKGYKGQITVLSGSNRYETNENVKKYLGY